MARHSRPLAALRTPVGATATALLALVIVLAIIAPWVWGDSATAMDTSAMLQGASPSHWAGTDALGRDIALRVLVATRLSVELALAATAIGVVIGLILGMAPSIVGRRLGRLITSLINIAIAFPGLLLALFFAVIFGVGAKGAVFAIGLATVPAFARLVQTLSASIAGHDFIAAARLAGVGRFRLMVRHILPNIGEPVAVNATIAAGGALLAFAGLSFLGLGVQPPAYDWGRLLGEGLNRIYIDPAAAIAPSIAVVIAGLAFNLFGETVAKAIGTESTLNLGTLAGLLAPTAARKGRRRPTRDDDDTVLHVEDLRVSFPGADGVTTPVKGVSFTIRRGETVGIVGESGSGKSLTALAVARLIEQPGHVTADCIDFLGTDLLHTAPADYRHLLGTSLAMVFQDPMTSFNPTQRIGPQLAELGREHHGLTRKEARDRAIDRLAAVRIDEPGRRSRQFPYEFSGGMRQRAMIGMGLMGSSSLIIADEPTTALDVTVQRDVLQLLADIRDEEQSSILLISHDISVVQQVCDRVLVMYHGRIVENLTADALRPGAVVGPQHPYTRALLAAVPDMTTDRSQPLATIEGRDFSDMTVPEPTSTSTPTPAADEASRTEGNQ